MHVVIFNWRDLDQPKAGGAEVITHALASGLAQRGHFVVWFTSRSNGQSEEAQRDGYAVVRRGSELTCRFHAFAWLRARRDTFDVIVDEVNTLPFLSRFATRKPVVLWQHQLAREVWLAEAPPVLAQAGYVLEPVLQALYARTPVVTLSDSSAESFARIGMRGDVRVIHAPLAQAEGTPGSPVVARIGYVGRVAPSKRIDHLIRALALVRRQVPNATLVVIGAGPEKERARLAALAQRLGVADAVELKGRIPSSERDALARTFDVLALASLREGWGLVVSEAARHCVPSVVYPVAGLVDSVVDERTGLVTARESPEDLANALLRVISDRELRDRLGAAAAARLRAFPPELFIDRFEAFLEETACRSSLS